MQTLHKLLQFLHLLNHKSDWLTGPFHLHLPTPCNSPTDGKRTKRLLCKWIQNLNVGQKKKTRAPVQVRKGIQPSG